MLIIFFLTLSNCCPFFSVSFHIIHGIWFTPFMLYSHCSNIFFQYKHKWRASLRFVTLSQTKDKIIARFCTRLKHTYFVFQWATRIWVTVLDGQMRSLFLIHLELWVLSWKLFMWSFCCIESAFRLVAQRLSVGTAVLPLVLWVKCNQLP